MLRVLYGSITNEEGTFLIDNMALVVDKSVGTVLKYGDIERSNIKEYYQTAIERFRVIDPEIAGNLVLITFDRYNGALSIEDICTITNYALNCHGTGFLELFSMPVKQLKERLAKLKEYGY